MAGSCRLDGGQTDHGSRFVERIVTVAQTCRQQQRPVFDFSQEAFIVYRAGQPAPSLYPLPNLKASPDLPPERIQRGELFSVLVANSFRRVIQPAYIERVSLTSQPLQHSVT